MKFPHLFTKIDKKYLVWFSRSQKFFLLEPLAFAVLQIVNSGNKNSYFENQLATKYSIDVLKTKALIDDYENKFEAFNASSPDLYIPGETTSHIPEVSATGEEIYYRVNKKTFLFHYASARIKDIFHPLFSHLQSAPVNSSIPTFHFSDNKGKFVFTFRNESISFTENELQYLKGRVFKLMIMIMYGIDAGDVMMTAHASAVAKNGESLLLCGPGGSGKSTAAILLQKNGFQMLTDDFALINKKGEVFSFPAAVSVKPGAAEILKEENFNVNVSHQNQHIPLFVEEQFYSPNFLFSTVVFIRYREGATANLKKLSHSKAIPMFVKEAWISPGEKNIRLFFDWLKTVRFYVYQYSCTNDLSEQLSTILKK